MGKLEKVQHAATRVMLSHLDYEERLQDITILQKFLLAKEIWRKLRELCHISFTIA